MPAVCRSHIGRGLFITQKVWYETRNKNSWRLRTCALSKRAKRTSGFLAPNHFCHVKKYSYVVDKILHSFERNRNSRLTLNFRISHVGNLFLPLALIQKPWSCPWLLSSFQNIHQIHQEILLVLPSEYIKNLTTRCGSSPCWCEVKLPLPLARSAVSRHRRLPFQSPRICWKCIRSCCPCSELSRVSQSQVAWKPKASWWNMKPCGLVSAAPVASCLFLQYTSSFPSLDLCHCSSFFSRYHHGLLTLCPLFRSRLLSKACLGRSRLLSEPSTHTTLRSPLLFPDPICNRFSSLFSVFHISMQIAQGPGLG